jgi:DNA-directed RNA polymerase specialized sigma24 family protein
MLPGFPPANENETFENQYNDKDAPPDNSLEEIADANPDSDPLATASGRQLEDDVKSALMKLPQRQRTIFQLKGWAGV